MTAQPSPKTLAPTPMLTPLALENAAVLKRLQARDFTGKAALAAELGRDKSNFHKTLKALAAEGLVAGDQLTDLTDAGANAVRAIAMLERGAVEPLLPRATGEVAAKPTEGASAQTPAGYAMLLWAQIDPDALNPRKFTEADEPALEELADSIARDGLLENLVVRPGAVPADPYLFVGGAPAAFHRLVAGERRHRAIRKLIERGAWPKDRLIPCRVVDLDDAGHRRVALIENLQRMNLRPIDEAEALKELMADLGGGTAEVAKEVSFTQRYVQQRLQLLGLPEKLRAQVNAGDLTIEKGREAAALLAKLPPIKQVELSEGRITVDQAKDWLAAQPKPMNLKADEWVLALEVFDKVRRDPIEEGRSYTEVHADARFDPALKLLSTYPSYLLGSVAHVMDQGGETGRFQAGVGHRAMQELRVKFGDVTDDALRLKALDGLYAELGVSRTPPLYHTPWLNGPFEISDDLRQEIEAARTKRAEDNARWAREAAARDAEHLRQRNAREAVVAAKDRAHELMTAYQPTDATEAVAIIAVEFPLPWIWKDEGEDGSEGLQAANGEWISLDDSDSPAARLIGAIVNSLAGHATRVDGPPAEDDDDPEDDDQADATETADA